MGLFMICQIPVILYILPDLPLQSKNSVSNSEFLWKLIKSPILVINLWITLLVAAGWTFLDPIIEPEMRNVRFFFQPTRTILQFFLFLEFPSFFFNGRSSTIRICVCLCTSESFVGMDRRSYTEKVDFDPDWLFWVRGCDATSWSGTRSSPS